MRKFLVLLSLVAMVTLLCSVSFASNVILTNDDNPSGNSATAYTTNSNGSLSLFGKLTTGGTGLGGGYFASYGTAIASNAHCVFVANTGSDTISSFEAPSYTKTGDAGIPGMFSANGVGGSIALHPSGLGLVSGNSGTLNISLWQVASNCKLTHVADFTPNGGADFISPVAFSPNGGFLVVPLPDFEAAELYSVSLTAPYLTDLGFVSYASTGSCGSIGCFPTGIDFTSDSKVVIMGNASIGGPSVITSSVTSSGLTNAAEWDLTNSAGVINVNVPHLSAAGYAGSGFLYAGASGYGSDGPSGVITCNFTESPLSITVAQSIAIPNADNFQGSVLTFGNALFAAEFPNQIQSASVASNGSLTLGPVTTDNNAAGLLSMSAYPNSR